jgi:regulatory protein
MREEATMAWQRRRQEGGEEGPAPLTGVITGIVASPRRPGRFDLLLDGKSRAVVSAELVARLELRVGLVLDAGRGAAVAAAVGELATFDRAVGLLAAQGRSARELTRRLVQKGEPAAQAEAAVEKLAEAGLVDDGAYARHVARSRVLGRGDSRRRLQQELARKGVARDVADEAVAEVFDDEAVDEEALVEAAARRKLRSLSTLDAPTRRRRLWAFLARRGHDGMLIRAVLGRVLEPGELEALDDAAADGGEDEEAPGI